MASVLSLENFFLTEAQIKWHPRDIVKAQSKVSLTINYKVFVSTEDSQRQRLDFVVEFNEKAGRRKQGYEIKAKISGVFHFPAGIEEKNIPYLIRVNGGTILYGVLRGELASLTGSFPGGKFVLPTVYMHDVVKQIEGKISRAIPKRKKRTLKKMPKNKTKALTTRRIAKKR